MNAANSFAFPRFPNDPQPATGFLLPAKIGASSELMMLNDWLSDFLELHADEVKQKLTLCLPESVNELNCRFVNFVLSFNPHSILLHPSGSLLRCDKPRTRSSLFWDLPVNENSAADIANRLVSDSCVDVETLKIWLRVFGGKRFSPMGVSGNFLACSEEPIRLSERLNKPLRSADESLWEMSSILYYSSNGDRLLVNEKGSTAWYVNEENRIEFIAARFTHFCERFAVYLESGAPLRGLDYFSFNPVEKGKAGENDGEAER